MSTPNLFTPPPHINPPSLTIMISDFRPESWNKLKRMHFSKWHDEVIKCAYLMREAFGPTPPYFTAPVDIHVAAYFDKRPFDSSNIPIKLFIDGLKGMVITDDDPRYVRRTSSESLVDRQRPRVEVSITPASTIHQLMPDGTQIIVLSGERPVSWNKLKRMNKYKWHKEVKKAHALILTAASGVNTPFNGRVDIDVNLYVKDKPLDSDNVPAKLYEDGLIVANAIKDDSPKYVRRVSSMCVLDKVPRLEIIVTPVKDDY